MAEEKKITGVERAAILLLTLGEQDAAEVLKHMTPKEVQKVGEAMSKIDGIDKNTVTDVLSNFIDKVEDHTSIGGGNEEYLRNVLEGALGKDNAGSILDRILMGRKSKGIETLKWMEARAIAEIIRLEHPQIIAIVLSYLEPDQSAEVLASIPQNMRVDVLMRIASLDGIQPKAMMELDEVLEKQFSGNADSIKSSGVGGFKTAANILNFLDSSVEGEIMEGVRENDTEMGDGIQELMFVFENLVDVDDRGIQSLLREISSENLILALKGADDEIKEKIFKNMSKRAGEMLRDDLESQGPVRLSDVEVAQKEILSIARRMSDAGEISLGGSGGEEYV